MIHRISKAIVLRLLHGINRIWYRRLEVYWRRYTKENFTSWVREAARFCGDGCHVNGKVTISNPQRLTLGVNVHIGSGCYFRSEGGIVIGDNCHISRNVVIYSESHCYEGSCLPYDSTTNKRPVVIERNVWIGMDVKVRPGVWIGEGAVIGIGVVVTRNIEPFEVVGSGPPKSVRFRDLANYNKLKEQGCYGGANGKPWKGEGTVRGVDRGRNVVFVCSTGRSGSQAIARNLNQNHQIVASHEAHFSLIRLSTEYAHGKITREEVKRELLALYEHASTVPVRKPVYLESDQKLSNLIPLLHELFPEAKFVWLIRNGQDVVASTFARGWFQDDDSDRENGQQFASNRAHSEFRLKGYLADPGISRDCWSRMSAFERNCWYWSFWNEKIRKGLKSIDKTKSMILRIENFEDELEALSAWLQVDYSPIESKAHNVAVRYRPHAAQEWTSEEKQVFDKWCGPLMYEFYCVKADNSELEQ